MIVLHVTARSNLRAIRMQGLLPQVGPRSADAGEQVPAVFCFADRTAMEDGVSNWLGEQFDENEVLVALSIDARGLPAVRGESLGAEIRITAPVAPARIFSIERL